MNMNIMNNIANSHTLIPENYVLVLTYVENAQYTTNDAQNATTKDTLPVVVTKISTANRNIH